MSKTIFVGHKGQMRAYRDLSIQEAKARYEQRLGYPVDWNNTPIVVRYR